MSAFIEEHRERFGVEPICKTLGVSASATTLTRYPPQLELLIYPLRFAHWKPVLRGPVESGQCTSADYTQELNDHGVLASVGSVGDAYGCDDAEAVTPV